MAIFYLNEQVNEQTEEMSSEQLLDNLAEACDSMMNMLDEGAYRRYLNKEAEKADKLEKEADSHRKSSNAYYNAAENSPSEKVSNKLMDKSKEERSKMAEKEQESRNIYNKHAGIKPSSSDVPATMGSLKRELQHMDDRRGAPAAAGYSNAHEYKKEWNKRHGDVGEDKFAAREPGTYKKIQDQKKAIKETCLYILSILDEI